MRVVEIARVKDEEMETGEVDERRMKKKVRVVEVARVKGEVVKLMREE